ncbi:MAG: hypothetical protein DWQ07_19060 [Chloroflexi bacterium]|nr:MAG: hypothetical protein DWQ07_19060 [Chloroflexota bacterium]MBL1195033.1 hypothetical protein [Chloroflexota bacterium]NOH12322.1 hypothetical protein [Chloroflexota bacterium]
MPRLSVWALRAALLNFSVGFTFGALLLANKAMPAMGSLWRLLPAHIELLLIGWIVQLVLGIAFWIFPRFKFPPKRGRSEPGWIGWLLLNLGVLLVSIASILGRQELVVLGRISEATAVVLFASSLWPRTKPTEIGKQIT